MKNLTHIILVSLFILSNLIIGQTQTSNFRIDSAFMNHIHDFGFLFNGQNIFEPDSTLEVNINEVGFDTLKFSRNNKVVQVALMKLKQNETYKLDLNSCSFYTIEPVKNPMIGMARFIIENTEDTKYLVGIEYFRELSGNETDQFYYSPPSAMCKFSAKPIAISSKDNEVLKLIKYHFLHGELLSVKFNPSSNRIELGLSGYVKDESDYRYDYQYKD